MGYEVEIRGREHRECLLRDARYFHFKGVEQRLIPCRVGRNLRGGCGEGEKGGVVEIELRLEDLRQSGVSFVKNEERERQREDVMDDDGDTWDSAATLTGTVYYSRPYVDEMAYLLILEISGEENAELHFVRQGKTGFGAARVKFWRQTLARMVSLVGLVVGKIDLPLDVEVLGVGEGNDLGVVVDEEADVVVDRRKFDSGKWQCESENGDEDVGRLEIDREIDSSGWVLKRSQWRMKMRTVSGRKGKVGVEVYLEAVKIEAYSCERARNEDRGFLL